MRPVSNITVFIENESPSSPRRPALVWLPLPRVSIQRISGAGPAYSTWPLPEGIRLKCESLCQLLNVPPSRKGVVVRPVRRRQPLPGVKISPSLPP